MHRRVERGAGLIGVRAEAGWAGAGQGRRPRCWPKALGLGSLRENGTWAGRVEIAWADGLG